MDHIRDDKGIYKMAAIVELELNSQIIALMQCLFEKKWKDEKGNLKCFPLLIC